VGEGGIWYPDEVKPFGNFGFAYAGLKLVVQVLGCLYMAPSIFAVDGTPLRKVRDTSYDQFGGQYVEQAGKWIRIGASYPRSPAGPRGKSAKVGIPASE